MTGQPTTDPAGDSDAEVERSMDEAPINPLTGTVEPEYVLVRDDVASASPDQREEPADDIDDAPINPETGMPEPTLTYVGEDETPPA